MAARRASASRASPSGSPRAARIIHPLRFSWITRRASQCDRCIRGCAEIRHNVLGRRGKGYNADIAFDANKPMGSSLCVSCGECMVSCPTGALTNKSTVKADLGGDPVDVEDLLQLPYFHNVSGTFLELNKNAVVTRHFRKGEIICREDDYGSTAFYILEGKAEVYLSTPIAHVKTEGRSRRDLQTTGKQAGGGGGEDRRGRGERPAHDSDRCLGGPALRPSGGGATVLGDLFGEMSRMSIYLRSATVRASDGLHDVRDVAQRARATVQRNKNIRASLTCELPRRRALEDHLKERAAVQLADAGVYRFAARQSGAGALRKRRRDLSERARSRIVST